jgi:hypothetical protein
MLFVNTFGVLVATGISTIQSIAVLHTNMVSPALLNSMPFAPKGGTPRGGSFAALRHQIERSAAGVVTSGFLFCLAATCIWTILSGLEPGQHILAMT